MRTKPLDRLLFTQGGECFFCHQPLPREEASIEHLVAVTHGGKDNDENVVACCQALNTPVSYTHLTLPTSDLV